MLKRISYFCMSLCFVFCSSAYATEPPERLYFSGEGVQLEGFLYAPVAVEAKAVAVVIGGSGFSEGGFGRSSQLLRQFQERGFVGFEWNKRGLRTGPNYLKIYRNAYVYDGATINNLIADARRAVDFIQNKYPKLPVFVVGGSEGATLATHLAADPLMPLVGVATLGTVVNPFVQVQEHQLKNQVSKIWNTYDEDSDFVLSPIEFETLKRSIAFKRDLEGYEFQDADVVKDSKITYAEFVKLLNNYIINDVENFVEIQMFSNQLPPKYFEEIYQMPSLFSRVHDINIPYLLVHGDQDQLTPIEEVFRLETMSRHLNKTNLKFKYYSGVGHSPSLEMFEEIIYFFEGVL